MREISCNAIISSIKEMCIQATHYLSDDMKSALYKGVEKEESPLGRYLIIKVRTVERRFENLSIYHSQIFLDIMLHLWCRCCGQRNQRSLSYFVDNRANPPVFRSEVMSPFRNTMSFVHCIERNFHRTQKFYIFFFRQRFRRHI